VGRNDYRDRMKQRNVILDPALDRLLVGAARAAGVSVNQFVVGVIEQEVARAGFGVGRGSDGGVEASGVGVGLSGGRVGDGDFERVSGSGRRVDWDGLLEAGRVAKVRGVQPVLGEPDPLDVIA
jgi:hypothetical protein